MTGLELIPATDSRVATLFGGAGADVDAEEMAGITPTFERIRIPSGGATAFEVPGDDPESPEVMKELQCVIFHHHRASVLWLTPMGEQGEDERPHAYSDDGINQVVSEEAYAYCKQRGLPTPGTRIAPNGVDDGHPDNCPYSLWGSARLVDPKASERGKANKDMRRLYIQRVGAVAPEVLTLSPTSLKNFERWLIRVKGTKNVLASITLQKVAKGSLTWSEAQFKTIGQLSPEVRAQAVEAEAMLKAMLGSRQAAAQAPRPAVAPAPVQQDAPAPEPQVVQTLGEAFGATVVEDEGIF